MNSRDLFVPFMVAAMCATNVAHADNDDSAYQQTNLVSGGAITPKTPDKNLQKSLGEQRPSQAGHSGSPTIRPAFRLFNTGQGAIVPLTVKIPGPKNPPPSRLQKGRSVSQSKAGRVVR